MNKIKEFGVLKWLVFPSMSLTLAGIVAWFNITVFGFEDGAFYIAAVVIIALFSIAINKYVGAESSRLAVAAFIFEILLILVLGANAIYSLSIQREMAVARQGERTNLEALREIKQLRGSRTQREALKKVEQQKSSQSVFAENERILLWLMAGELLAYILSAFTLYALSHLVREKKPSLMRDGFTEPFPHELDVEKRSPARRPELAPKTPTRGDIVDDTRSQQKPTRADTDDGLRRLRECLKLIAFSHPPGHYKVDLKPDNAPPRYLIIRLVKSSHGQDTTAHSVRAKLHLLDDAMKMPRDAFRERLEKFLRQSGFEI